MKNLFEFYERDYNSDVLALINTGKRISGKVNLMIKFTNYQGAVYTDGHCIYLPHFCREEIKPAQGFVAHESGHIGYGSFELGFLKLISLVSRKYEIPIPIVKQLTNVLEDVRINAINKVQFPGFYKNLRDYALKLLPEITKRMNYYEDFFIYLDLFMEDYPGFQKKPQFKSIHLSDEEWQILKVLKTFLLKALTPNATIIALDQLCKLLKNHTIFKKIEKPKTSTKIILSTNRPGSGVFLPYRANPSNENDIIVFTAVEDFFDESIEENPTTISKTSEKMLKKLDKIDLSVEDIKDLTTQLEQMQYKEGVSEEKDIESAIGTKISQINKPFIKKESELDKIIKDIESLEQEPLPFVEQITKKKQIIDDLKKYITHKEANERNEITQLKEEVDQINDIINDFQELNNLNNPIKKKEKKGEIHKKLNEYLKNTDTANNKTRKNKEKLQNLIGDLFNTLDDKASSANTDLQEKQAELLQSLQSTQKEKEEEIKRKYNNFFKEKEEINNIIRDIEQLGDGLNNEIGNSQKQEILSRLRSYNKGVEEDECGEGEGEWEDDSANKALLGKLVIDIKQTKEELAKRIAKIGMGTWSSEGANSEMKREIIETRIENEQMQPIRLTYQQILATYRPIITKMKMIFTNLKPESDLDNYQKRGRLNKNFIKTITSNYQFKNCFTRKVYEKLLRIVLLVDISGSMKGQKLVAAKIAMIMFVEALKQLAAIRIVLFTGNRNVRNIVVKDFGEPLEERKIDRFGCHEHERSNLDGLSIKHEASKLCNNELFIIVSDGKPAGHAYGLNHAMHEVQKVQRQFKIFAFSIDAEGDHLNKMYGKNWILAKSMDKVDLGQKIMQFSRFVVNEFYI
ncbi:MAG: hypothetical protein BAJALOKI1v1_180019 [Promethearchaeota archaeon]|nr:MAG: hypothetical protein BAJALOKI1v1_180019 [Candidatus Lokiarchaeota archaeon]